METHGEVCVHESFVHFCSVHSQHTFVPSPTLLSTPNDNPSQQRHQTLNRLHGVCRGLDTGLPPVDSFFLTATFGLFACPQVVRRLLSSAAVFECSLLRAVAELQNQFVVGLFADSASRVPVVYSTSAFWFGSAIVREAANCIQTSFRNNSADVWIVAKRRSDSVIRSASDRRTHSQVTGSRYSILFTATRSTNHSRPVPYIQVFGLTVL